MAYKWGVILSTYLLGWSSKYDLSTLNKSDLDNSWLFVGWPMEQGSLQTYRGEAVWSKLFFWL